MANKKRKKKKRVRIKLRVVFLSLIFILILGFLFLNVINIPISNIFVSGNTYLTDQQIIEISGIEDYPSTFKNFSSTIKKRLKKNAYIKNVKVYKKFFTMVYIEVEENRPLFFSQSVNKTVLVDTRQTEDKFSVPTLINYVPDVLYEDFIVKMSDIKLEVLDKISEMKYDPDEVDDARFLFTMTDGNYVYLTLNKLESINNYNDIVKQFDNKKGILYLNSGGYFEVIN